MEQHPWKTLERTRKEKDGNSKCKQKWGPATHLLKPNKEASWGKGEVCFILYTGNGPLVGSRGGEEGWCYIQRQHSQLWQLSWNWSCGDLTSLVLLFLGAVSPQFQGQFVSITLRQILDSKRSNHSIWLREINCEYTLEGLMLKLKLQYLGHLMWTTNSLEKSLMLEKIEGRGEEGIRGWDGWMASPMQ